jgi:hypothetical protein
MLHPEEGDGNMFLAGLDRNDALREQLPRQLRERLEIMIFTDPFELVETVQFRDVKTNRVWETRVAADQPVEEWFIARMSLEFT